MKMKLLKVFPDGLMRIEEFEIEEYEWDKNHKFAYVLKGHPRFIHLEPNEEIVGLDY